MESIHYVLRGLIRWEFWLNFEESKLCEIEIKMRIRTFQFDFWHVYTSFWGNIFSVFYLH